VAIDSTVARRPPALKSCTEDVAVDGLAQVRGGGGVRGGNAGKAGAAGLHMVCLGGTMARCLIMQSWRVQVQTDATTHAPVLVLLITVSLVLQAVVL
jgi:hypothetical protein